MIWPWTPYAKELRDINKIRKQIGYPPINKMPKGEISSGTYCPIAKAIDHGLSSVSLTHWVIYDPRAPGRIAMVRNSGPLTARLVRFVRDFDGGRYPELVENPARREIIERWARGDRE